MLKWILASVFIFGTQYGVASKSKYLTQSESDKLYRQAQREFSKSNFSESLELFKKYLEKTKFSKHNEERLYIALDQVGTTYLRIKKDPKGAITFLKKYEKDKRLSDSQQDSISEWLAASNDWLEEEIKPGKARKPKELYRLGKKYFDKAEKKKTSPRNNSGNADYAISAAYLRPLIVNHDNDSNIGEALLMMGIIRSNIISDKDYWSENFYLKEAIRRHPHTKLSERAWRSLEEDVRIGYTGSSGDNTPASVNRMLSRFKKLAQRNSKKKRR